MEVLTRNGECVRLTPLETNAMRLIRGYRCNYYLNLSNEDIPINIWNTIEDLILSDKIYPAITTINIQNSNLTIDDVNIKLRDCIIY